MRKFACEPGGGNGAAVTDLNQILHDRFGFSHFRGVQEAVVERGRHAELLAKGGL